MRYMLAVSGGVDSVVLLDQFVRAKHNVVVAHFDHGIREDSAHDARFVAGLAEKYGVPYMTKREALGASASEEKARRHRYAFLRKVAVDQQATLVTAHHLDDLVETIAINLMRGTGWRGLAVLGAADIYRPLLGQQKADLYQYAVEHRLEWVEDATNRSTDYLRNRLRYGTQQLTSRAKQSLQACRDRQLERVSEIDTAASEIAEVCNGSRYFMSMIEQSVAFELLRHTMQRIGVTPPDRPTMQRLLLAIKTAQPGRQFDVSAGVIMRVSVKQFVVETDLR